DIPIPCTSNNSDRVGTGQGDFVSAYRDGPVTSGGDTVTSLASHLNCADIDSDRAVPTLCQGYNATMFGAIAVRPDSLFLAGTGHKDGTRLDGEAAVSV